MNRYDCELPLLDIGDDVYRFSCGFGVPIEALLNRMTDLMAVGVYHYGTLDIVYLEHNAHHDAVDVYGEGTVFSDAVKEAHREWGGVYVRP